MHVIDTEFVLTTLMEVIKQSVICLLQQKEKENYFV